MLTSTLSHILFNCRLCWIIAASSKSHYLKFSALYSLILISLGVIFALSSSVNGFFKSSRSRLMSMTRASCFGAIRSRSRQNCFTGLLMPGFYAKWKQMSDLACRRAGTNPIRQNEFRPVLSRLIDCRFLLCLITWPMLSTTSRGISSTFRWSKFS